MTPTEQALARELARHPAWRWRDGMMSNAGRVWTGAPHPGGGTYDATPRLPDGHRVSTGHYPDLADPATQGCLIAMLGDRLTKVERVGTLTGVRWHVETWNERAAAYDGWKLPDLGEALARAWLAVNGGSDV